MSQAIGVEEVSHLGKVVLLSISVPTEILQVYQLKAFKGSYFISEV